MNIADDLIKAFNDGYQQGKRDAVVRGEWIQKHHIISLDNMTLTGTYPTCSLCGYAWIGVAKNTNYCPNCGCDMRGESRAND